MKAVKGNVQDVIAGPLHQPYLKESWAGVQNQERMENAEKADDAPG